MSSSAANRSSQAGGTIPSSVAPSAGGASTLAHSGAEPTAAIRAGCQAAVHAASSSSASRSSSQVGKSSSE